MGPFFLLELVFSSGMLSSVLPWLFVFAIGQGLFLCVALLSLRQTPAALANRILAGLVLLMVLVIAHAWLSVQQLFGRYPQAASAIATLPLLLGPLLWLYLRSLLLQNRMARQDAWHLLPFGLAVLAWAPLYLQPAGDALAWRAGHPHAMLLLALFAAAKAAHFCTYFALSGRLILRLQHTQPDWPLVGALRRLMAWLAGGLLASAVVLAFELAGVEPPLSSDAVSGIALTVFIYGLAYLAMRMPLGGRLLAPAAEPPAAKPRYAAGLLKDAER